MPRPAESLRRHGPIPAPAPCAEPQDSRVPDRMCSPWSPARCSAIWRPSSAPPGDPEAVRRVHEAGPQEELRPGRAQDRLSISSRPDDTGRQVGHHTVAVAATRSAARPASRAMLYSPPVVSYVVAHEVEVRLVGAGDAIRPQRKLGGREEDASRRLAIRVGACFDYVTASIDTLRHTFILAIPSRCVPRE